MPVLHQIIAVEKGTKNRVMSAVTEIHKSNQKAPLFEGLSKNYTPLAEDGEKVQGESALVQRNAASVLKQAAKYLTEIFDITAQRDFTNCAALSDVVVDGRVLVRQAPVTYLLFLEKQLLDVRTLVTELPTLDPAFVWTEDANTGLFNSNTVQTTRTKKVEDFVVVIQPTKEHPGKHEKVTKDVAVGTWTTTRVSGALPSTRKEVLLDRVEKLIRAVKFAREEANGTEVKATPSVGDALFAYLLA